MAGTFSSRTLWCSNRFQCPERLHLTGHAGWGLHLLLARHHLEGWHVPGNQALQVLQQHTGALERLQAHLAGEVATRGRVQGQVPLKAQLGVVALAALFALERLFVGVVRVQVVLQVVLPVKHFLTIVTLVGFLRRVRSHVP